MIFNYPPSCSLTAHSDLLQLLAGPFYSLCSSFTSSDSLPNHSEGKEGDQLGTQVKAYLE